MRLAAAFTLGVITVLVLRELRATAARMHVQSGLDDALEGTFPASDPVALTEPHDDEPRPERRRGAWQWTAPELNP